MVRRRLAWRIVLAATSVWMAAAVAFAQKLDPIGRDLKEWFRKSVSSAGELDYSDLLEWYGLRFNPSEGPAVWKLEVRPDAADAHKRHCQEWLGGSRT